MAVLDPLHPLQSSIVELLAEQPGVDVSTLHGLLAERHVDASIQNLYRTVAQLVEAQVLLREKGKLSLNLVWASHLVRFSDTVRRRYLDEGDGVVELPRKDGEKRDFTAESLAALDPVWNHVIAKIIEQAPEQEWYEYDSHPLHLLGMTETETRLYAGMGPRGHRLYGNDTFLDRHATRMAGAVGECVIAERTPFPKEGYILWVCGDYVVDCVLPEELSRHFAFFFRTVESASQFDPALFADVFRMKARCRLAVWKSAKEAELLRLKMRPFFRADGAAA